MKSKKNITTAKKYGGMRYAACKKSWSMWLLSKSMENVQRGRSGMEPVADTGLPLIPRITNFCLLLCWQFFFITSNVSTAQIAFEPPPKGPSLCQSVTLEHFFWGNSICAYICSSSLSFSIFFPRFLSPFFLSAVVRIVHTTPPKES